jgi:hypothetical protein
MKGYNFIKAAKGGYPNSPDVDVNDTSDKNAQFELRPNQCVYGDMEGVPFLFINGPEADDYNAYEDTTTLYIEYFDYYTSVGIKMGETGDSNDRQFTMEMFDADGRIATYYAQAPEETSSGAAMGTEHDGSSHNAYMVQNRQGIDETYEDGEYFYRYANDGQPIWSGPDEGKWDASEVLIVSPSADPPTRWPDGAITETTLDATITSDIPNDMCPGDRASVTVEMSNDHVAADIEGTMRAVMTDTIDERSFRIKPGQSETLDIDINAPSKPATDRKVLDLTIDTDADVDGTIERVFRTNVGTTPNEVQLENVELPSEAVEGREIDGSADVVNDGDCSIDATVSYQLQ